MGKDAKNIPTITSIEKSTCSPTSRNTHQSNSRPILPLTVLMLKRLMNSRNNSKKTTLPVLSSSFLEVSLISSETGLQTTFKPPICISMNISTELDKKIEKEKHSYLKFKYTT